MSNYRYSEFQIVSFHFCSVTCLCVYSDPYPLIFQCLIHPNFAISRMPKDRIYHPDERLEEGRIRERMKAMPVWRKDFVDKKQRGPVVGQRQIRFIEQTVETTLQKYKICF